jgi:hypothetical protein
MINGNKANFLGKIMVKMPITIAKDRAKGVIEAKFSSINVDYR